MKGNLTSDGASTFGYSSENLLTSAPSSTTLAYDPALRLYQIAGPSTTRFAYDGVSMIAEYNGANALQRRFVFGPNIDEPIVQYEGASTTDRRFMGSDERGSVISLADGSGTLLSINRYDEYGKPQSTNSGRFQYSGQKWIGEAGLYDYKARDYLPQLGIFGQTDPIGYADSLNLYDYVLADPVNLTDPLGLCIGGGGSVNYINGDPEGPIPVITCPRLNEASGIGGGGGHLNRNPSKLAAFIRQNEDYNGHKAPGTEPPKPCAVSKQDSENSAAIVGSAAALPEYANLGIQLARGVAVRSIITTAGVEVAEGLLAVLGGPVVLGAVAIGVGVYAYDRYSGGKVTKFVNRQIIQLNLQIGEGCK